MHSSRTNEGFVEDKLESPGEDEFSRQQSSNDGIISYRGENGDNDSIITPSSLMERQISECGNVHQQRSTPPIELRWYHYICVAMFTLSCYVGSTGVYGVLGQYIYHRYAHEVGIPDGALNQNHTSCIVNKSDPNYPLRAQAQEMASKLNLISSLVSGIPTIPTTLIIGAYSDRIGRKMSTLIPWSGFALYFVILICWMHFELPMWVYVLSALPSAFTGGFGALLASMFAFVSDATTGRQRSIGIALLELSIGFSQVISSLGVGMWIKSSEGFAWPLYGMCGLLISSAIYLIPLPETSIRAIRHAEMRRNRKQQLKNWTTNSDTQSGSVMSRPILGDTSKEHDITPWTMFKKSIEVFTVDRNRGILLGLVMLSMFIHVWAMVSLMSVNTLYLLNQPFCWNSLQLGIFGALKILVLQIGTFSVVLIFRRRVNETWLVVWGFISYMCSCFAAASASTFTANTCNYIIGSSILFGMFSSLVPTLCRAIISKLVTEHEQGVVYAALGCLESFSFMSGSVVASGIYSTTVKFFPGFIFLFICGLLFIGLILILVYYFRMRRQTASDRVSLVVPVN